MDTLQNQYGFEATFISEVPEDLNCVVCHLVLRQPVQIMTCGHRFCKPCFEKMKGYSQQRRTQFRCPTDNEIVDLGMVFEDKGMARTIGNMKVKCGNDERGCAWVDDLRDLQVHEENCQFREIKGLADSTGAAQSKEDSYFLKELCKRMTQCEEGLSEKEKDIAFLKLNLQEMKKSLKGKEEEVSLLKSKNINIEKEMKLLKDRTDVLSLKNQVLEKKLYQLPEISEDSNGKIDKLSKDITNRVAKVSEDIQEKVAKLSEDMNGKVRKVCEDVKLLNEVKDNVNKAVGEVDDMKAHMTNVENILFCDISTGSSAVVLHWKFSNYQHYSDVGKKVCSPIFYTHIEGYAFKLLVQWTGEEKEKVGLFLCLCRVENCNKSPEPFNFPYSLHLVDSKGIEKSKNVSLSSIDDNREDCFTLHPGKNETTGLGFGSFILKDEVKDYLVNDMLTIRCTLTPPK